MISFTLRSPPRFLFFIFFGLNLVLISLLSFTFLTTSEKGSNLESPGLEELDNVTETLTLCYSFFFLVEFLEMMKANAISSPPKTCFCTPFSLMP